MFDDGVTMESMLVAIGLVTALAVIIQSFVRSQRSGGRLDIELPKLPPDMRWKITGNYGEYGGNLRLSLQRKNLVWTTDQTDAFNLGDAMRTAFILLERQDKYNQEQALIGKTHP